MENIKDEFLNSSEVALSDKFESMDQVHNRYYEKFVELCRSKEFDQDVQKMVDEFVVGRIGAKKGVRAYVFNEMFKIAGGTENIDIGYLLAAIELQLAAGYCFNVAADSKGGYESEESKKTAFKTQALVEGLSLDSIDKLAIAEEKKDKIKDIFENTWQTFYEAEIIDTVVNLFKNRGRLPKDIAVEIENFAGDVKSVFGLEKEKIISIINGLPNEPIIDFTLERTYKVNAVQLENLGKAIGVLLDLDDKKTEYLSEYGKNYGIEMMIVNDIQDYSLDLVNNGSQEATREKNKNDVFSDLREGKISWPIKYSLELDSESEKFLAEFVGRKNLTNEECEEVRKRLITNGALSRCVQEAVRYEKMANAAIRNLDRNESSKSLQEISSGMRLSKYVYSLEDKYNVKLQPTKKQRKIIDESIQY
jgi:hypothetical protein